jgi:hypothetical protein
MSALTVAALTALIAANNCVPPALAPIMVGIAQHESGLDPAAVHHNANGTIDVGIAQINSANFGWLGLTMATAFDPCRNIAAGARVLLAKYNGNPPDAGKALYAASVLADIQRAGTTAVGQTATTEITGNPAACSAPPWDTWAQQDCRESGEPSPNTGDPK